MFLRKAGEECANAQKMLRDGEALTVLAGRKRWISPAGGSGKPAGASKRRRARALRNC